MNMSRSIQSATVPENHIITQLLPWEWEDSLQAKSRKALGPWVPANFPLATRKVRDRKLHRWAGDRHEEMRVPFSLEWKDFTGRQNCQVAIEGVPQAHGSLTHAGTASYSDICFRNCKFDRLFAFYRIFRDWKYHLSTAPGAYTDILTSVIAPQWICQVSAAHTLLVSKSTGDYDHDFEAEVDSASRRQHSSSLMTNDLNQPSV